MRAITSSLVLVGIGGGNWVHACSLGGHPATAAQIAKAADFIVRAHADGYVEQPSGPLRRGVVQFRVLEAIKGEVPEGKAVRLAGQLEDYDGPSQSPPPYDFVRPGGRHGDCYATDYQKGAEYLLFLRVTEKGGVTANWAPLAATNEEIQGATDPWVTWVKEQIRSPRPQPEARKRRSTTQ